MQKGGNEHRDQGHESDPLTGQPPLVKIVLPVEEHGGQAVPDLNVGEVTHLCVLTKDK